MAVNWKKLQRQRARKAAAVKRLQQRRQRKTIRPSITRRQTLKALEFSCGNLTLVADRLGVQRATVKKAINRPDWIDVKEALQEEIDAVADIAEQTIRDAMSQRLDISTASRTAQWLLTRARHKDRQLGDESRVILEGGDKPIHTVNENTVDIETLSLPLEMRKAILEAIESKQKNETEQPQTQEKKNADPEEE